MPAGEKRGGCAFKQAATTLQHMASLAMPFFVSAPHAHAHTHILASLHVQTHIHLASVPCHSAVSRDLGSLVLAQEKHGDLGNE